MYYFNPKYVVNKTISHSTNVLGITMEHSKDVTRMFLGCSLYKMCCAGQSISVDKLLNFKV